MKREIEWLLLTLNNAEHKDIANTDQIVNLLKIRFDIPNIKLFQ